MKHRRSRVASTRSAAGAPRPSPAAEWLRSILGGALMFIVMHTFLVQTFTIVSGSMEGTLLIGDFLVLNKAAYGAQLPLVDARLPGYADPGFGDVVVFRRAGYDGDLVKRVAGVPGDTLAMVSGRLIRNGEQVVEPYVQHDGANFDTADAAMYWQLPHLIDAAAATRYAPSRDNWGPLIIPDGMYFMLGDNRDNSLDSRFWGLVPRDGIRGRVAFLYFSTTAGSGDGTALLPGVRWSRIGNRVE